MRLVVDSSVLIAAVKPAEPEHADALAFVDRLRAALTAGDASAFAPPELWLEVHVVERRLAASRGSGVAPGSALSGLAIELVAPGRIEEVTSFLDLLARRMRGRRPFTNATDLVYLWAAWSTGAMAVTLDRGMLGYHRVVCDVTRPEHVGLGRLPGPSSGAAGRRA
jgi:predicted nucleic acid-binding protein